MIFKQHKEHCGISTNPSRHLIKTSYFGYETIRFFAEYQSLKVSYMVSVSCDIYDSVKAIYESHEDILLDTSKYTEAYAFFVEKYEIMATDFYKKHNKTWSDVKDNVIMCKLLDNNPSDMDVYYYNIFERYIIKDKYVIAHMNNNVVAYIINDNGIFFNKEFVDTVKFDNDSFSNYIRLYAKHINKHYGMLETVLRNIVIITNMHGQSVQYDIFSEYFDKYTKAQLDI